MAKKVKKSVVLWAFKDKGKILLDPLDLDPLEMDLTYKTRKDAVSDREEGETVVKVRVTIEEV